MRSRPRFEESEGAVAPNLRFWSICICYLIETTGLYQTIFVGNNRAHNFDRKNEFGIWHSNTVTFFTCGQIQNHGTLILQDSVYQKLGPIKSVYSRYPVFEKAEVFGP